MADFKLSKGHSKMCTCEELCTFGSHKLLQASSKKYLLYSDNELLGYLGYLYHSAHQDQYGVIDSKLCVIFCRPHIRTSYVILCGISKKIKVCVDIL